MEKWIPTNLRLDGVSHQGARPWVNHYYFHLISWWVTCPSMNGDPLRGQNPWIPQPNTRPEVLLQPTAPMLVQALPARHRRRWRSLVEDTKTNPQDRSMSCHESWKLAVGFAKKQWTGGRLDTAAVLYVELVLAATGFHLWARVSKSTHTHTHTCTTQDDIHRECGDVMQCNAL